jgi:cutinase
MRLTVERHARRLSLALGLVALLLGSQMSSTASAQTQPCAPVQILYARGTFEPATPYGLLMGGVVNDLQADVPGTAAYEVNYPADLTEPSSVQTGDTDVVNEVTAQAAACPNEKFVLSGYSQGGNVIGDALGMNTSSAVVGGPSVAQLPASLAPRIVAVLLIAPTFNQVGLSVPAPYSSVTDLLCTTGDLFCSPSPNLATGLFIHLFGYEGNLSALASYAASNYTSGKAA